MNGSVVNSTVTVNNGGTLRGVGTVDANLDQTGGTLNPGDAPGILTMTDSLTMMSGSTLVEQLGGTTAGTGYSQVLVTAGGTVSLGGATLDLSLVNGFLPSYGQQFTVIDNQGGSSVSGAFSQGSTIAVDGYTFSINYAGGGGDNVVLTVVETVTPTANGQSVSTNENTALSGTVTGGDEDENPLTYAVVSSPAHGSLTSFNTSTGVFTYTPTTGYYGGDSFTFTATDGTARAPQRQCRSASSTT